MYDDGYVNILNQDYSRAVVDFMASRNAADRPGLRRGPSRLRRRSVCAGPDAPRRRFECEDAREMILPAEAFDLVLDKGLLDALVCGTDCAAGVEHMLGEASVACTRTPAQRSAGPCPRPTSAGSQGAAARRGVPHDVVRPSV